MNIRNMMSVEELIEIGKKAYQNDPNCFNKNREIAKTHFKKLLGMQEPWLRFGYTWGEFKTACGASPTRAENALIRQTSKHISTDSLKKLSKDRLSWGNKFVKPNNKERFKVIMVASDFHDIDVDPFSLRMWLTKLEKVQPDIIVINGDLFDLPEFSRYTNDPREYNLGGRIKFGHDILEKIRKVCPDSQIDLIEGNHEFRLIRHLLEQTPMMAELLDVVHGMDVRKLLGLDKFEINYIAKTDLFAFTNAEVKKSINESDEVYYKCLHIRHHPLPKNRIAFPGISGHHHHYEVQTHFNPIFGSFEWVQTGGMCKKRTSFTDGRIWNTGFITAYVDTKYKRVNFDYTSVGDTSCMIGGEFYEREKEEYYEGLMSYI